MGSMTGRSTIVTGAAQGIGRAIGEALLDDGGDVCFADFNGRKAAEVAAENASRAAATDARVMAAAVDVTQRDQVQEMIVKTVETFGKLDVKFNNAGVNKPMNFLDVTEDNWYTIMRINGLSVLIGMQEAAKQMIAQGTGGQIINTASIAGRQGYDNVAPYCASKFAVVTLTQSGARDLAKHNISVTGFAPGVVATELWETWTRSSWASVRPSGRARPWKSSRPISCAVAWPHRPTSSVRPRSWRRPAVTT
jgi:meso-butanediol dehydrogenase/(S,S)-butanediol dehydrogenase/diacetyl reductase